MALQATSSSADDVKALAKERFGRKRPKVNIGSLQLVEPALHNPRCHICDRGREDSVDFVRCPRPGCRQILCKGCMELSKSKSACANTHQKPRGTRHKCGGYFHQNASSKYCRQHIPSKMEKLEKVTGKKMEKWTIKTNLDSVLYHGQIEEYTYQRLRFLELEDTVPLVDLTRFRIVLKEAVVNCRDITYTGALLANSFVLDRHRRGLAQHPLNQDFFDQAFRVVCGPGAYTLKTQEEFDDLTDSDIHTKTRALWTMQNDIFNYHQNTFAAYGPPPNLNRNGISRILTEIAAELAKNTATHVKENFATIQTNR